MISDALSGKGRYDNLWIIYEEDLKDLPNQFLVELNEELKS